MTNVFVSNAEILDMFKEIDNIQLGNTPDLSKIKKIKNLVVIKLSFLVYNQTSYYKRFENYEDLVQEGFIGLIKATNRYDWKIYPNFFAYANQWIRHSVKRAASRFDIIYNPNKDRVIYTELQPENEEEDLTTNPENIFLDKEKSSELKKALSNFSKKEIKIVDKIFGLTNSSQTLREIGPQFSLTHERVRQIKNNVIEKLKQQENIIDLIS